jgi:Fe2+ transport system protein FeoA
MICRECGTEFDESASQAACGICSSRSHCAMVKCPNCGIEMPREPHPLARLRDWLFGRKQANLAPAPDGLCQRPGLTLAEIAPGGHALVERFLEPSHVRKFLSLGVLPGTAVTVLKQTPAVVVRVGYSEFAFDKALAQTVLVRKI